MCNVTASLDEWSQLRLPGKVSGSIPRFGQFSNLELYPIYGNRLLNRTYNTNDENWLYLV
ncbi:hypothetical protein SFRURICE_016669 [Spodoptera frugiperda]|nr:hypothetical protein SFRURICE_016669 [Spodoptera frugiperda]